jgi:16S rRNA G527 N7-methylase RsmG
MTPEERAGLAGAINDAIGRACAAVRGEFAQEVTTLRREGETVARALEQRCNCAETHAQQLQRDLDAARELAGQPGILRALVDADGVLHVVQRNGETLTVPISDLQRQVAAAVSDRAAEAEERMGARLDAHIARALQRLGDAPAWARAAVYGPEAVVSCYVGRTYGLRAGVKASLGQEPGDHPDVWERIGSHGLRVMKAKPAALEAGDVFTEGDSRFIHDGTNTTLLVARALRQADLERVVRPLQAELRAVAELAGSLRRDVDDVRPVVQRAEKAANESHAWCISRALMIDSPALARIVERADELDELLDTLLDKKNGSEGQPT